MGEDDQVLDAVAKAVGVAEALLIRAAVAALCVARDGLEAVPGDEYGELPAHVFDALEALERGFEALDSALRSLDSEDVGDVLSTDEAMAAWSNQRAAATGGEPSFWFVEGYSAAMHGTASPIPSTEHGDHYSDQMRADRCEWRRGARAGFAAASALVPR